MPRVYGRKAPAATLCGMRQFYADLFAILRLVIENASDRNPNIDSGPEYRYFAGDGCRSKAGTHG